MNSSEMLELVFEYIFQPNLCIILGMAAMVFVAWYGTWANTASRQTREVADALAVALDLDEARFQVATLRRPASVDLIGCVGGVALRVVVEGDVAMVEWGAGLGVRGGRVSSKGAEAGWWVGGSSDAPVGEVHATGDAAFDARFEVRGRDGVVGVLEVLDSGLREHLMELSERAEVDMLEVDLRVIWEREAFLSDAEACVWASRALLRTLQRAQQGGSAGAEVALDALAKAEMSAGPSAKDEAR